MQIEYLKIANPKNYFRCRNACRQLELDDFNSYRDAFERCVIEPGILTGRLGKLCKVSIEDPMDESEFASLMGIKRFWVNRIQLAKEFLRDYERLGRKNFLRQAVFQTKFYANDLSNQKRGEIGIKSAIVFFTNLICNDCKKLFFAKKYKGYFRPFFNTLLFLSLVFRFEQPPAEKKNLFAQFSLRLNKARYAVDIQGFLDLFDNIKAANGLIPSAKLPGQRNLSWRPYDFPWAINYFGYLKKRDGSHRRAIINYLGFEQVDTIVVDFKEISQEYVNIHAPFLADKFMWFYQQVLERFNQAKK